MKRATLAYLAILFAASLAAPQGAPEPWSLDPSPRVPALPGAPMTPVAPLPTMPAEPAGNGVGVRSGGDYQPSRLDTDAAVRWQPETAEPSPAPPRTEVQSAPSGAYSASATWCAPRGDQCTNWGGDARLAAVNSFTWGDAPYWVRLWYGQDHADALVVSHCACNGEHGYIDVSPAVFRQLAPLSRGRIDVAVEVLDWPVGDDPPPHPDDERMRAEDAATLPPTDSDVR